MKKSQNFETISKIGVCTSQSCLFLFYRCFFPTENACFKYRFMVYIEFFGKYSNKSNYRNLYKKNIFFVFKCALVGNMTEKNQRSRLDSKHHRNRTFAKRKHNTNRKLEKCSTIAIGLIHEKLKNKIS